MFKSRLFVLLAILATQWLWFGCRGTAASSKNENKSKLPPPTSQNTPALNPEVFGIPYPKGKMAENKMNAYLKPVNDACIAATGKPLNLELECECPTVDGQGPRVFSISKKACVALGEPLKIPGKRTFKECHDKGFKSILANEGIEAFNACIRRPAKAVRGNVPGTDEGGESSYEFRLADPTNDALAQHLASLLDSEYDRGGKTLSYLKMAAPTDSFTKFEIKVGMVGDSSTNRMNGRDILDGVLFDNYFKQQGDFRNRLRKILYEADPSALKHLLAPAGVFPPPELYPDYEGDDTVFWTLSEARHVLASRGFKPQQVTPLTGSDCSSVCRVFGTPFFFSEEKATLQVIQEKVYSGGVIIMDNIWLYDDNYVPMGALVLGQNGQPMYYIKMKFSFKDGNSEARYEIYDRRFEHIASEEKVIESNLAELEAGTRGLSSIDQTDAGQGVLLCETFTPNGQDWLIRGPYGFSAQDATGSVYGWYENKAGSPFRMFAGIHRYIFRTNNTDYFRPSQSHGLAVSEVIRDTFGSAKIAPMGYCQYKNQSLPAITNNSTFTGPYAQQRVKVMNSSFTSYGKSLQACEQSAQHSFGKALGKILSVSAAGNESLENPTACPQTMATHTSIVVAAAENSNSENPVLSDYSNRGETYADIAAHGYSMNGELEGTSFAAPRVSGVAAKIAYTYDHLLPQDIRLAILTTAHIPAKKLPVRTGGVLRGERAMAMASCLHIDAEVGRQQGKTAPITKRQARRCLSTVDGFGGGKADAQIDFLSSRPLIFE